jgi:molybdopterin synthase catalytic subunit
MVSAPLSAQQHNAFKITFAPLSLDEGYTWVSDPSNGAIVVMSGTVRDNTNGQPVESLEYQAYEPMAIKVFQDIAAQIQTQWPAIQRIAIYHRIGRLSVGEVSVLVAVGSPHRAEAFAACQFGIDTLKHTAPIWKKEHWSDGSSTWVSIGACEDQH